jgi:hypothetical protein
VIAQAGAAHPDAFAVDLVSATPRPARAARLSIPSLDGARTVIRSPNPENGFAVSKVGVLRA